MITEAKESQDLLSASWRPKKTGSVNSSPSSKLWVWGVDGIIPSLRRGDHIPIQQSGREQTLLSSAFLFYSGPHWIRWSPPTLGRTFDLLSHWFHTNFSWKRPHGYMQKWYLVKTLGTLIQASWCITLTTTLRVSDHSANWLAPPSSTCWQWCLAIAKLNSLCYSHISKNSSLKLYTTTQVFLSSFLLLISRKNLIKYLLHIKLSLIQ